METNRLAFGLILYAEPESGRADSFALLREEVQTAEAAGFDSVALIEHHQSERGEFSAPLVWLSALAASTSTIRLGVSVALLPLYHPIRLAEEIATVDRIAGGRFYLGVGLGYQEQDFRTFGVRLQERVGRFVETLQILRLAWRDEPVNFQGAYHTIQNVSVAPKPFNGQIPIWGGAMVEAAVRRIARECDGWLAPSTLLSAELAALSGIFTAEAVAHGRAPRIILNRTGWVADSLDQARSQFEPALAGHYGRLGQVSGAAILGQTPGLIPQDPEEEHRFVIGAPADCIRQIDTFKRHCPFEGITIRMRLTHGPAFDLGLRAIERFGQEVIAHYRRNGG